MNFLGDAGRYLTSLQFRDYIASGDSVIDELLIVKNLEGSHLLLFVVLSQHLV
jgi:hypothetical protein